MLPWGFWLADVGVPVDLWIGERDPGRAPLDAPEIHGAFRRALFTQMRAPGTGC